MAAVKIVEEFASFRNTLLDGFKYNLQVFPDTITAAALLFALLLQSTPLAALSGSIIILNFIHPTLATFLSSVIPGTVQAGASSTCSGHFPGTSYERLIRMSDEHMFGALDTAGWPSYYSTFLGFLAAYVGAIPFIYSKELSASPRHTTSAIYGCIVLAIVVITTLIYRVTSGCDTVIGSMVGLLSGAFIGICIVGLLAYISDRRITNILMFPLIRDKATDGKPIYVCERRT